MIDVKYRASGDSAMQTITVGELISALAKCPQDAPVMFTWEGIRTPITEKCVSTTPHPRWFALDLLVELDANE